MVATGSIELIEVPLTERKLVERFLKVPWYIYREHYPSPYWVPPLLVAQREFLDTRKNPFFEHAECRFWIARVNNRDVGRIAATIDADWERVTSEKTGQFGFFESPDDADIAHALFDVAFNWLKQRGMTSMIGPMSLSTNHQSGLLVDGYDSLPCIEMTYNPPYYEALLNAYGLEKLKNLWQWRVDTSGPLPPRMDKLAQRLKKRGRIKIRTMQMNNWDAEVDRLLEIYNDAWLDLWGFVPLGDKELRYLAENLKMVIQPELAIIAEIAGEPVAVSIGIMDINPLLHKLDGRIFPTGLIRLLWDLKVRRKVTSGRIMITGIKEGYRHLGIGAIMYMESRNAIERLGWKHVHIGWTLEDNDDVNSTARSMEGEVVKTFRLYSKAC